MDTPLISVIVPVYNAEPFLEKCVTSIMNQTYINIELILVNDGSTDGSLSKCEDLQAEDGRIRIIDQKNMGQSAARRRGVEVADGKYIGFVDSDDWIEPTMFQHMMGIVMRYQCDLVSVGRYLESEDGTVLEERDNFKEGQYLDISNEILPTLLYDESIRGHGLTASLWNKLFRKDILKSIMNEADDRVFWGEDLCLVLNYCLHIKSIYISHNLEYHYQIRNVSVSHCPNEKRLLNAYWLYQELDKIAHESDRYNLLLLQIKQYIVLMNEMLMRDFFDIDLSAKDNWIFNFSENIMSSRFVIYGAGSCGQALYNYCLKNGIAQNVVAWADEKGQTKETECLHSIIYPEQINDYAFEYILISVQKKEIADSIKEKLIGLYGIDEDKIIWKPIDRR